MRIIAGKFKAKRIEGPKTEKIRPTLDRVKEALFSILGNKIQNAKVLDLFGGTGNLAIESVSRGASFVLVNDIDNVAIRAIISNTKLTNSSEYVKITKKDYVKSLNQIIKENMLFDVIFLDPPYESMYGVNTLKYISDTKDRILSKDGLIVYETDKSFLKSLEKKSKINLDGFENLTCFDERIYGNIVLKLYKWR